ncbi:MAG: alanine dehydrogenase [Firmicutes bacterium]|nr:alanine dehydrogenase [Bacillota bacterium]
MRVGIVKEIKNSENRVAIIPANVSEFIAHGHEVYIERGAGLGSGFSDEEYAEAGAVMCDTAAEVWNTAELLYKVKEILPPEYGYLRDDLVIMTYIHSNSHKEQTDELLKSGCVAIALEDVSSDDTAKKWPLVANMSELAGKGGFLAALYYAQSVHGGPGLLLANVAGDDQPIVSIIGCGFTGKGAAEFASALGNKVRILDVDLKAMETAKAVFPPNVSFMYSNRANILKCLKDSDVLINCILWDKTRKDHLIYREDLKLMKKGAMIIDVACDDNGAVETCRSTTHEDPVYYEEGILHYCVDNIPSAFSKTSSVRFSNDSLPFALEVADKGVVQALKDNKHLRRGLTTYHGILTMVETGIKQNRPYEEPDGFVSKL